jgi:hypothetical protein
VCCTGDLIINFICSVWPAELSLCFLTAAALRASLHLH